MGTADFTFAARDWFRISQEFLSSRNVIVRLTSNAVGLVQEVFPVAQRCFGVLVDGNDDRLDMVVAPN
jgi:hypothetical protein